MKKILFAITAVAVLLALVPSTFGAQSTLSDSYISSFACAMSDEGEFDGFTLPADADSFKPLPDKDDSDDFDGDSKNNDGTEGADVDEEKKEESGEDKKPKKVTATANVSISHIKHDGVEYFRLRPGKGSELTAAFDLTDMSAAGDAFVFPLHAQPEGSEDSEGYEAGTVTVKIVLYGKSEAYHSEIPVTVGKAVLVYADLSEHRDFAPVSAVISFSIDEKSPKLDHVTLGVPVRSSEVSFDFQHSQGIPYISVTSGSVSTENGVLRIHGDSGAAFLFGKSPYSAQSASSDKVKYLSVYGRGTGCALTAGGIGLNASEAAPLSLGETTREVLLKLNGVGDVAAVNVKASESGDAVIEALTIYETSEKVPERPDAVTSLEIINGKLTGKGVLDYETVKKYSKCSLGIFMIPAVGEEEPILIGKISVASRFSFSMSLAEYPHAASGYMFYAAVIDKDDVAVRVSTPRFVSSAGIKSTSRSHYGLYGADPIAVYESGAAHVMVDVDIYRLMGTDSISNLTVSRGGYVFGIDSGYLSELDSHMSFYISSGVSVYVRLIVSAPLTSRLDETLLTYSLSGDEYMIRSDLPEGANMYMALVSFLCKRYPNVSSFVLSSGINSQRLTGLSLTEAYKCASDIAMAARLVYGAASETSDVFITLPLAEGKNADLSPTVISSLIAERLSHIGTLPWALMLTSDECALPRMGENVIAMQRANGTAVASYTVFCYAPAAAGESLVEDYKALCAEAASSTVRVVFLSEASLDSKLDRATLNRLKNEMKSPDVHIYNETCLPSSELDLSDVKGSAYLWDFSASHSTHGWVTGYGIDYLASAPADLYEPSRGRVLRCITEKTAESSAGIFLCRQEIPLNLSASPLVEIAYSHDSASPVNIVFVFAGQDDRAEFSPPASAVPDSDGAYRMVCDLTEYSKTSAVEYVAVIVYSADPITFELSSVKLMSRELTDDEVASSVKRTAPTVKEKEISRIRVVAVIILIILCAVMTVLALVVNRRRDAKLHNVIRPRRYYR